MGFVCEHYSDQRAGLAVAFRGGETTPDYFAGDSANDAMEHFDLYLQGDTIMARSDSEIAMEAAGITGVEDATELRQAIDAITDTYSDDDAVEHIILFPAWMVGKDYVVDERIRYDGKLYRVLQAHHSQADWTPDVAVSLFVQIHDPGEEWPEWVQPVGAQDAYAKGAKVRHNDRHWISNVDGNVWEPGTVGTEALWLEANE